MFASVDVLYNNCLIQLITIGYSFLQFFVCLPMQIWVENRHFTILGLDFGFQKVMVKFQNDKNNNAEVLLYRSQKIIFEIDKILEKNVLWVPPNYYKNKGDYVCNTKTVVKTVLFGYGKVVGLKKLALLYTTFFVGMVQI
eukprot:TRINITY_DN2260_c0_g1_i4.p3 TRINITY_DN2260_c0_g1~~TRINITY_DN2260_c0_g1_i4.p3  ORF type:complete len:140 (-),score=3.60 TRINITY_DN2260_c0_g1_i4:719-1138(-)